MNLSPAWVGVLSGAGHEAMHWVDASSPSAPDTELMAFARDHEMIVFTHDLDFGAILYATQASAPSVIQVRAHDLSPDGLGAIVIETIERFRESLVSGSLLTIDSARQRVRVLPLRRSAEG